LHRRYICFTTIVTNSNHHVKKIRKALVKGMTLTQKRVIMLLLIVIIGAIFGRLAVRAVLNLMLGGTLFGGNFL